MKMDRSAQRFRAADAVCTDRMVFARCAEAAVLRSDTGEGGVESAVYRQQPHLYQRPSGNAAELAKAGGQEPLFMTRRRRRMHPGEALEGWQSALEDSFPGNGTMSFCRRRAIGYSRPGQMFRDARRFDAEIRKRAQRRSSI